MKRKDMPKGTLFKYPPNPHGSGVFVVDDRHPDDPRTHGDVYRSTAPSPDDLEKECDVLWMPKPVFIMARVAHIAARHAHVLIAPFSINPGAWVVQAANRLGVFPDWLSLQPAKDFYAMNKQGWCLTRLEWVSPQHQAEYAVRACPATSAPAPVKLYDGLTAAQCLQRFQDKMRRSDLAEAARWKLSAIQVAAARDEWSRLLAEKQAEAKEKERTRVVVDLEYEEWE